MAGVVFKLLNSEKNPFTKKKAAVCLLRMFRRAPSVITKEMVSGVVALLAKVFLPSSFVASNLVLFTTLVYLNF